jgi:hypothetical protein
MLQCSARSPAAAREHRYQRRQVAGQMVVAVEVGPEIRGPPRMLSGWRD